MKVIKKMIIVSTLAIFLLSLFSMQGMAIAVVPAVDKNVNLAEQVAVVSSADNSDAAFLTDGLLSSAVSGTAVLDETFTVDLKRYSKITDIKLWPASDSTTVGADLSNVALEISNDGVEFTLLDSQGDMSGESLTAEDAFTVTAEPGTVCRYVRVRKTAAGSYKFGELQVFAAVKAIEVSREADAEVTETSNSLPVLAATNAVDGYMWSAWRLTDVSHTTPVNLVLDLGKDYPISLLELYQADPFVDPSYTAFDFYGASELDGKPGVDGTPTADLLLSMNGISESSKTFTIPTGNYRYVVLSKAARHALAIAEFKAYTFMPEFAYSELSGQTLTVRFSDEMDPTTFGDIVVKVDGVAKGIPASAPDNYTAQFTLDSMYYGSTITAEIPATVTNSCGVAVEAAVATEFSPASVEMQDFKFLNGKLDTSTEINSLSGHTSAAASVTFTNNQPEKTETVILLAALYDANNTLICVDEARATLLPGSAPTSLKAGFTLPTDTTGCTMSVFIWKDYEFMKPWTLHQTLAN